jgi:uncharacterized protein (TIGR03083 family)
VAAQGAQEAIDLLDATWRSIDELCTPLSAEQWLLPTDCPGWTVQDNLAHIIGLELVLEGEDQPPAPYAADAVPDHVKNELGATNEVWVASLRGESGQAVLDRFRAVADRRLASLRSLSEDDWEERWPTPAGVQSYRDFMGLRSFDAWSHEQDIRRAIGRPGGWAGAPAENALARVTGVLPFVVGKKVGAPDGTTVVVELSGPAARTLAVGIDGRAAPLDHVPEDPTTTVRTTTEAYTCLVLGRWDPSEVLADGRATLEGDRDLGVQVLGALAVIT